jgi:hypothetical protein
MAKELEDTMRKVLTEEWARRDAESEAKWKQKGTERQEESIKDTAEHIAKNWLIDHPRDRWQEIVDRALRLATAWDDEKQALDKND